MTDYLNRTYGIEQELSERWREDQVNCKPLDKRLHAMARSHLQIGMMLWRRACLPNHPIDWDTLPSPFSDAPLDYGHTTGPITAYQLVCPAEGCGWTWQEPAEPEVGADLNCTECGHSWRHKAE